MVSQKFQTEYKKLGYKVLPGTCKVKALSRKGNSNSRRFVKKEEKWAKTKRANFNSM